jgi:tetratricopeptide (TPR) repeat protein
MQRRFILITMVSFFLLPFSSLTYGQSDTAKAIDNLIAQNKLEDALKSIESGLAKDAKSVELLARKSRVTALKADSVSTEEEKVKLYEQAEKIASEAVAANPKEAEGYLRRAAAKGKLGLYKGILESRALILDVRKDANKAIELAPAGSYNKALASYILGRVHMKLGEKPKVMRIPLGLGWASKKKGRELLKNAVTMAPNSIPFNLDYAMTLIDQGEKGGAKQILEKIGSMPIFDPPDTKHQATAKKLLSEL